MTRCQYLTARCPSGCECWLHPAAVRPHLQRCRQHPWVENSDEMAVVTGPAAQLLIDTLPARLLVPPNAIGIPLDHLDAEPGIAVSSPIPGVAPRRWLHVALAAADVHGPRTLTAALDPARFAELEASGGHDGQLAICAHCGHTIERRGLATHQANNTRCRWMRAAREVRSLWEQGWRDPLQPAARSTAELDRAAEDRAVAESDQGHPVPTVDGGAALAAIYLVTARLSGRSPTPPSCRQLAT